MKNFKRIALCVLALTLVCQIAFAAVDITGAWVGTMTIVGYKSPKVYGVVDGTAQAGKARFVVPNVGSGTGLKAQYQWRTDLLGDEKLYAQVSYRGKTATIAFDDQDIVLNKKGTKLTIAGEVPNFGVAAVAGSVFRLNLVKQSPAIKKISVGKAKVGVTSYIKVKTTDVTDYVVLTDANDVIVDFNDDIISKSGTLEYNGWTKGKNTLYVYAGLKDGDGRMKISGGVGTVLSAADKANLTAPKKIVKKAK